MSARAFSAAARALLTTASRVSPRAPSAAALATVRTVPSTGTATAPYALVALLLKAALRSSGPRAVSAAATSPNPRNNWLMITPELPRAPMSDPVTMARTVPGRSDGALESASTTAASVSCRLVPVSPSGTG